MTDIEILTTEDEVEKLAHSLRHESSVAVDLEMDAMHNYREKICLAQISTTQHTVLADPLVGGNLAPLAGVFAETGIRKIFHAVDYDLRSLKRDYGFAVHNLFDTMIAAQFCGEEKIGLADLLGKYFGVKLDKKYQRADWSHRPLKKEMIAYAAEDTRHLHRLVAILEEKLRELGRLDWLHEECKLLEEICFDENSGPLFLRFKGAGKLERRQLAQLEELLQWRDKEAERRNCPHFKVVGNKSLLALILTRPEGVDALSSLEGMSSRQVERYGQQLLNCLDKANQIDEEDLPLFPRAPRIKRDPQVDQLLAKLKVWRTKKAADLAIDPGVLVNNSLLEAVARQRPKRPEDLHQVRGLRSWQIGEIGEDIVAIVR
ncbi:MAG: ribonuclease D [Desulfuromonas sp.]|nr:MAG: ribonuclease D [Desulfuromonas sp.]